MADIPPQDSEFIASLLAELDAMDEKSDKNTEKLNDLVETFTKEFKDAKKIFEDIESAIKKYKSVNEKGYKQEENKKEKQLKENSKKNFKNSDRTIQLLKSIDKQLVNINKGLYKNKSIDENKLLSTSSSKRRKKASSGGMSLVDSGLGVMDEDKELKKIQRLQSFSNKISEVTKAFTGGVGIFDFLFGGQIASIASYNQEMHEIAAATQGITGEMPELQEEWNKITTTVEETGFATDKFAKKLTDLVRKGIKNRKETEKVLAKSFNFARVIGSDAEQTADMFHEWNVQLRLNANDLSYVSRHMKEISKATGVSGNNLISAAKSSEQFLKKMKDAGTLTAAAAKNIIAMQTAAQKFGAEDLTGKIQTALSSQVSFLYESTPEDKALIFEIARLGDNTGKLTRDIQQGIASNNSETKKLLAKGMKELLLQSGLTHEDLEAIELGIADTNKINKANLILRGRGTEVGKLMSGIKAYEEVGKNYSDKLEQIEKSLRGNLSDKKREELIKQKENIQREGQLGIGLDYLRDLEKFSQKQGTTFEKALMDSSKHLGEDTKKDLNSIGISVSDGNKMFEQTSRMIVEKIKSLGGEDLTESLNEALNDKKDLSKLLTFIEKANEQEAIISRKTVTDSDKISASQQKMLEIQDKVRNWLQQIYEWINKYMPTEVFLTGVIGAIVAKEIALLSVNVMSARYLARIAAQGGIGGGGGGIENMMSGREGRYSKGSARVRARAARINAARGGRFGRLGRGVGKIGRGIGRVGRGIGRFSGGVGGLLMAVHSINAAMEALDTFNDPKKVEAITGINKISQTVVDKAGAAAGSYVEAFTFGILKAETLNNAGQQFGEKIYKNFQGTMDKLFSDNTGINDPIKQAARTAQEKQRIAGMTPEALKAENIQRSGGVAFYEKERWDSFDRLVNFEKELSVNETKILAELRTKMKDQSYLSGLIADLNTKGVAKDDPTMVKLQKSLDELVAQSKMSTELQLEFARIKNEHAEAPHAAWRYIGEKMAPELAKKLQDEYAKSVGGGMSFKELEAADVNRKAKGGALSVSGRSMMKINKQLWEVGESGPEVVEIKNAARMDAETKALDTFARVIPMMKINTAKSLLPIPDMHTSITKEKATEKQESDKITNEISDTNELMQEQIDLIKEQNSHLIKLVSLMSMSHGGGSSKPTTGTTANDSGLLSPDYGKWQYSFYQIPGIQVTTEGD